VEHEEPLSRGSKAGHVEVGGVDFFNLLLVGLGKGQLGHLRDLHGGSGGAKECECGGRFEHLVYRAKENYKVKISI
jgi:hypothetical protein